MKKHGGKYPGPLEFIKTMQGIKLDAIRGPVSLDDRLTAIKNIYIKKVEKKKMFGYDKDELWNTVVKTYTNVGQFWTYDKDGIPQAAGLFARLPAVPVLSVGPRRNRSIGARSLKRRPRRRGLRLAPRAVVRFVQKAIEGSHVAHRQRHLESLRDGTVVYVGSERLQTSRGNRRARAAQTVAGIYDLKADPRTVTPCRYEEDDGRHRSTSSGRKRATISRAG